MTAVKVDQTAVEVATEALLRKLGVAVPVETVGRDAFRTPPSEQVVRISQVTDAYVTNHVGGPKARAGNLLTAPVRVVGYGVPAVPFATVLLNSGWVHVAPEHRHLVPGEIDLVELHVQSGPGGRVGRLQAWSVTVTPGILSPAPPLARNTSVVVKDLATSLAGEISHRPRTGPYAGQRAVWAEARARVAHTGESDDSGLVEYPVVVHIKAGDSPGGGANLAQAHSRVEKALDGLQGTAHAGLGRVQRVEVDWAPPGEVREVEAVATVTFLAWEAPKGVRRS